MVDIVDLVNREGYECGVYSLENDELVSTFLKNKVKSISEFKLYLTKNKDKFKTNITKIIELL